MRISVTRPGELDQSHFDLWRGMQQADEALQNPFLTPEFACAVDRRRSTTRVAVLSEGGRVVGFFPFERRRFGVGKPLGAGLSDRQALIAEPGLDFEPAEMLEKCRLSVWEFDHLVSSQSGFKPYHEQHHASPMIDLSNGYQAYVTEREQASKRLVPDTMRKFRKLEREVGPARVEFDARDHTLLHTLMDWKSAQYRRTGVVDRFDLDWIVALLHDLVSMREPGFSAPLAMLYAGDQPIAGHLGLRCASTLAYWFPAYAPQYGRYSPGIYLLSRLAEDEARRGVRYIDLGRGEERYKDRFSSWDFMLAEGSVVRHRAVHLARRHRHTPLLVGKRYLSGSRLEPPARKALTWLRSVTKPLD